MQEKKKIGRNDPCHCGSGVKYKKCHLNREDQARLSTGEIIGMMSKNSGSRLCFHAPCDAINCAGKIIEAHTVSKSGSLRKISRKGKVYYFKPDVATIFKNKGKLRIREIGVGDASTFPGFCAHHDKQLFAPIEDQEFVANQQTTCLLGYRSITKEIHAKEAVLSRIPMMRSIDKGRSIQQQNYIQDFIDLQKIGTELGLRDSYKIKSRYDDAFIKNDFSNINYFVIQFSENPHLLFSGCIYPEFDFDGNVLQILGIEDVLDGISVNAIATPQGGAVVFQWCDKSHVNEKLFFSLLKIPKDKLANAITQFVFESFENLFMSPDWWDGLSIDCKLALESKVSCGASPMKSHTGNCFIPDGNNYFEWRTPRIETNIIT